MGGPKNAGGFAKDFLEKLLADFILVTVLTDLSLSDLTYLADYTKNAVQSHFLRL